MQFVRRVAGSRGAFAVALGSAAFAVAFLAFSSFDAATRGRRTISPVSAAGREDPARAALTLDVASAGAFGSVVSFRLALAEPLPEGAAPVLEQGDLTIAADGVSLDAGPWLQSVEAGVAPDRRSLTFTLRGRPFPPEARHVAVTVAAYLAVLPGGEAVRRAGPWFAAGPLDRSGPEAVSRRVNVVVDTGFGWRYVLDELTADETSVRLVYHVEGSTANAFPVPPSGAAAGAYWLLPVRTGEPGQAFFARPAGDGPLRLQLGGFERAVLERAAAEFWKGPDGAWRAGTLDLGGTRFPASLRPMDQGGSPSLSVRVTAPVMFNGRAAPGREATLTDDLGNQYHLDHGGGSLPPRVSTWEFRGPVHPRATLLSFRVAGYARLEVGDWWVTLPLP